MLRTRPVVVYADAVHLRLAGVMVRYLAHQKVGVYRDIRAQDYEMWIRVAKEFRVATINLPLAEYRRHQGNSTTPQNNQAQIERDILHFIREQIEATPLDELIPNLQSKAHAYALRAAIYLHKDSKHARGTPLAKAELEKAYQLAPNDPLLRLWEGVLAIHEVGNFPQYERLPSPYREQGETLIHFDAERKRLPAQGIAPSSSEAVDLRRRFEKFCSALTRQTFKTAVGKQ